MEKFRALVPEAAAVIRDGVMKPVPATDIVVGDIIRLKSGEGEKRRKIEVEGGRERYQERNKEIRSGINKQGGRERQRQRQRIKRVRQRNREKGGEKSKKD